MALHSIRVSIYKSETSGEATKVFVIIRYSVTLIMQHEACSIHYFNYI